MKRLCAVFLAVVCVVALAACGSSKATHGAKSSPSGGGSEPAAGGPPSGTLTIGTFGDIQSFDPAVASFTSDIYLTVPYDSLLRQDRSGNLAPGLATKWSQPTPSSWSFTLRSGVTFTDGTPFDATAVKANLEHMKTTPGPNQYAFAGIATVATPTPDTVEVTFTTPDPSFGLVMSTSAGVMASPKAIAAGTLTKDPVGTGGWIYDAGASQPGVKYVFNANPHYWDSADQGVKTVQLDVMADNNARMNALSTGAVQMINLVPATQVSPLESKGAKIIKTQNPYTVVLFLGDRDGKTVPALGDPKVREAMNLAMDRKALVKTVSAGIGTPSPTLFAPGSPWYDAANASLLAFNLKKAKSLLAEAGYPDGFSFDAPVFASTQLWNEAVSQQLAQIGIKMKLVTVPPGQAGPDFRKQQYPVTWGGIGSLDPFSLWQEFVTKAGGWDPFGVDTSKIDALATQAAQAAMPAEQKKLYGQMEQQILSDGVFLVLGQTYSIDSLSSSVKGQPYIYNGEITVRPQGIRVG